MFDNEISPFWLLTPCSHFIVMYASKIIWKMQCVLPAGVEFYASGIDSKDASTTPRSYPIVLTGMQVSDMLRAVLTCYFSRFSTWNLEHSTHCVIPPLFYIVEAFKFLFSFCLCVCLGGGGGLVENKGPFFFPIILFLGHLEY